MGKKNWLFCSTEMGARQVAVIQTLLASCRAHGIDPYTYLVDVLQRVKTVAASEVDDLIPRRWLKRFGANPLRSDLYRACQWTSAFGRLPGSVHDTGPHPVATPPHSLARPVPQPQPIPRDLPSAQFLCPINPLQAPSRLDRSVQPPTLHPRLASSLADPREQLPFDRLVGQRLRGRLSMEPNAKSADDLENGCKARITVFA